MLKCKTCGKEVKSGKGNLNYIHLGGREIYCAHCWNAYAEERDKKGISSARTTGKIEIYQS